MPDDQEELVFRAHGVCPLCQQEGEFVARRKGALPKQYYPNWFREGLRCSNCNSIPRHRALFSVLSQLYPNWAGLSIHESSPGHDGVSALLRRQCANYVPSQYDPKLGFGNLHPSGRYRSEDLERQTFADESFDLVITQDVFEHLFAPDRAIREIARTLKPGGAHIMTVPLANRGKASARRARLTASGVDHIAPPVYHGNPMSADGSLVTIDWGYDILEYLSAYSGLATSLYYIDDLTRGIQAAHIEVIVCRKPAGIPFL